MEDLSPTSHSDSESIFKTRMDIGSACKNTCVLCLKRLGDAGHCAPVLDPSHYGVEQVEFSTDLGILPSNYSRSAVGNGINLCYQDPGHIDLSTSGNLQRYWQLPIQITPILAGFLHRLSSYTYEEIRLGIELRCRLILRCDRIASYSVGRESSLRSEDQDCHPSRYSERRHGEDDDSATRKRSHKRRINQTECRPPYTSHRRLPKPSQVRFNARMTTDQILFAARGVVLF